MMRPVPTAAMATAAADELLKNLVPDILFPPAHRQSHPRLYNLMGYRAQMQRKDLPHSASGTS